ncbi:hypothetical protein HYW40_00140 [Candidatus Curtissbacteria bacterium]|nr:hypothetical protein [Candidatus Curtissbacteria bacterium]
MTNEKLISFFGFWLANALAVLAAALVFKGNIVLGTDKVSMPMAAVIAGFTVTVLTTLVAPAVDRTGYKVKDKRLWVVIYLLANLLILWIIKRFALVLGLGISGIIYVVILGVILTAVQWGVVAATGSMIKAKKG